MNENEAGGVGTPNPLNQDPTPPIEPAESEQPVVPVEPTAQAEQPMAPIEPIAPAEQITNRNAESIYDQTPGVEQAMVAEEVTVTEQVTPTETAPVVETMEPEPRGSIVEPKKKSGKKVSLILAIILILVAIGCGAAAIVILNPFGGGGSVASSDAVPEAVSKLFSEPPKYVDVDGAVTLNYNTEDSAVESLSVSFQTKQNIETTENVTNATITATLADDEDFSFEASEIHTTDGTLFLKLSGIAEALAEYREEPTSTPSVDCDSDIDDDCVVPEEVEEVEVETNCVQDETGTTNCVEEESVTSSIMDYLGLFEAIDDEWIMIPGSDFSNVTSMTQVNVQTQCLIGAVNKLSDYGDNLKTIYESNPFIDYSTNNISIAKKKDPIYQIVIDNEKLAGFINAMANSGFMNELNACVGEVATNTEVKADDLAPIVNLLPKTYVEIDSDNNFTRLYLTMSSEDGLLSVVADLSFSYPTTGVKIEEPASYISISDVLTQALSQFYGTNIIDYDAED